MRTAYKEDSIPLPRGTHAHQILSVDIVETTWRDRYRYKRSAGGGGQLPEKKLRVTIQEENPHGRKTGGRRTVDIYSLASLSVLQEKIHIKNQEHNQATEYARNMGWNSRHNPTPETYLTASVRKDLRETNDALVQIDPRLGARRAHRTR